MERWMTLSGDVPCLSLIPLGTYHNGKYYIDDDCLVTLDKINIKLKGEDPTTRPLRCTVGFLDIINKDLVPILINSKDQPDILNSTIKLLAELTTPLECLVMASRITATQQVVIYKLTQFLYSAKESFLDGRATGAILDHVRHTLEKQPLSSNANESVNQSLLLIRNILHATERPSRKVDKVFDIETTTTAEKCQDHEPRPYNYGYGSGNCTQQNQLLRKLFAQGLDRLLIDLLASSQNGQWIVAIVQVVSLLYKDRPVENILKLLQYQKECTSESSSFDEDQSRFDKSRRSSRHSSSSGFHSDYSNAPSNYTSPRATGSATRISNRNESQSSEFQQSSFASSQTSETKSFQGSEKQEQTLVRQIETGVIETNDISKLLKEFTINFMLKGYGALVGQLYHQLMKQSDANLLDKSHFLWLISYFLPIACQLDVKAEHLRDVLTIDLLCYLTWEAVHQTEELEMDGLRPSLDLKPCLRRTHLCVKAIREYLKTLERMSSPSDPDRIRNGPTRQRDGQEDLIIQLLDDVPVIRDLRQLFLLQLRQFNRTVHSRDYLLDVISANHVLLVMLERQSRSHGTMSFDLNQHLTQFCSKTILDRYGTALEDFKSNGPFVNDCILTILHHVAGDLGRADLLCRPAILRPFIEIWKEGFNMRDEWNDLIEYVMQKSLSIFQQRRDHRFNGGNKPQVQSPAWYLIDIHPLEYSGEINIKESFDKRDETNIESLVIRLKDSGFQKQLDWIQSSLLSACATRLGNYSGQEFRNPMTFLSFQLNLSCPVVPWTEVEASALRSELFFHLLLCIGLIPLAPPAVVYPRIPREWSPDTLYSVALLLGPVDQKRIDFDLTRVKKIVLLFPNWRETSFHGYAIREGVSFCEDSYSLTGEGIPGQTDDDSVFDRPSPRPFDSVSTTSSLEVHKTDSSDDEDMVDGSS